MADPRLQGLVHRFYLASTLAFDDWENPTVAELNANPDNDPDGLIFNVTCALNTDGTQFDLGDPETDDSLTFCQRAGEETEISKTPEIVFEAERSRERWLTTDPSTFNTANLAFSLLAWRGVEYFAIMSIGEGPDAPFEVDHRIKMAQVATDHALDVTGTGENIRLQQNFASRGNVNWNYRLAA